MAGGLPLCKYDASKRMFLVVKHKGKTLSNGGFGVTVSDETDFINDNSETVAVTKPRDTYLFIEEAIFLHEQGLIELVHSNESPVESRELYSLLQDGLLSLPVYLVYAHLRAQTYRVIRHTPRRRELLDELMAKSNSNTGSSDDQEGPTVTSTCASSRLFKSILADLRQDSVSAATPTMYEVTCPTIAFDVYPPDCNFKRSNPGLPAFHVAACSFAHASPTFGELQRLVALCGTVPLRIATVADSGAVVMFGLTDFGVPSINDAGNKGD
jgi:hypothetical protein